MSGIKETIEKAGTPPAYSLQSQKTGRSITHFTGTGNESSVVFGKREHRGYSGASAGRMLKMRDRSSGIVGAIRQKFGAPKLIEKGGNIASKDGPLHDEADDQGKGATVKECPECGETYTGEISAHTHKGQQGIRKALQGCTDCKPGAMCSAHAKTNPAAVSQIKDARANKMGVMKSLGGVRSFIGEAKPGFDIHKTDHFHENGCTKTVGPRGGVHTSNMVMWRRNGGTKTWKRKPGNFSIPIKHGMYGPYGYITQDNQHSFHAHDECPTFKERATP